MLVASVTLRPLRYALTNVAKNNGANKPMLLLSIILGTVPLIGIVWTAIYGSLTTVDGLFLTLILLSLSGILFLNVYLEIRKKLAARAAALAKEQK